MAAASNEPPETADGFPGSGQAKAKLDDAELNVGAPRALQKVELDLDDAPFLEEEQAPPPPVAAPPEPERPVTLAEEPEPLVLPFWKSKKFLLLAVGVVLLLSLGAGWFAFLKPKAPPPPPPPVEEPTPPPPAEPPAPPEIPVKFQELAPFLVEKVDDKGRVRLFTFKLKLAYREERISPEIGVKLVVLRDAIYYNLRNKSFFHLTDKQTMDALRDELRGVVNNYLNTGQIEEVLFDEALVK